MQDCSVLGAWPTYILSCCPKSPHRESWQRAREGVDAAIVLAQGEEQKEDEEFAIVFAAMGVNMETAHFFKQVSFP